MTKIIAVQFFNKNFPDETVITSKIANELIANCDPYSIKSLFMARDELKFQDVTAMILLCEKINNVLEIIFNHHQDELDLYLKTLTERLPYLCDSILPSYLNHSKYDKQMWDIIMKYVKLDEETSPIYYHETRNYRIEDLIILGYDKVIDHLEPTMGLAKLFKKYGYDLNRLNMWNAQSMIDQLIIYLENEDFDFQPVLEYIDESGDVMDYPVNVIAILIKKGFDINKPGYVANILQCGHPEKINFFLDMGLNPQVFIDATPINEKWKTVIDKIEAMNVSYLEIMVRTHDNQYRENIN